MAAYRVIIAEDEELMLHNLIKKVTEANSAFEVVDTAQTGEQALEKIKNILPDLLITDIQMPVMDGLTLVSYVHEHFPDIKVIIISGFSDFSYAKRAIDYNVCAYLLKPIDKAEFSSALLKVKTTLDLEAESYSTVFNLDMASTSPKQVAAVLHDYITHNYTEDINLNSISRNVNYSASYLTKIFNQYYNITPNKLIISLRIQKAQNLLLHNPGLTIRQISTLVGYPDQAYFSRFFKKQTGMSPFDYRDSAKESSSDH